MITNINLETDWQIWPVAMYVLIIMAIMMIRISNRTFEAIGYRIISTLAGLALLYALYENLVP